MTKPKKEIYTFEQLRRECNLTDTFRPKVYHQNDFMLSRNSTGIEISVLIDLSTNLMWSEELRKGYSDEASRFVEAISSHNFFGFDDWRLPTVKELLTLIGSKDHGCFWSSDFYNDSDLFSVDFWTGGVSWSKSPCLINPVRNYVRNHVS